MNEIFQWLGIVALFAIYPIAIIRGKLQAKRVNELESKWELFKSQRKELYDKLADPATIEKEMEAGARAREMHDANRTVLPHPDEGPPATITRPLLRGQKPGSWRPRNPGSPSKQ